MKVGGVAVTPPPECILVLPRDGEDLVFRAQAIEDWDEFDKLCPAPVMPVGLGKGGEKIPVPNDPAFKAELEQHGLKKMAWMVVKSLQPSNIEWEKVKVEDPRTWQLYEEELREAGVTAIEIQRIVALAIEANQLDEAKLKAARESFVRGQGKA